MDKKEQVMIDFNNLEPSPFNSFMDEDHDRIDDMVGNIKSLGLITPLSVIGPFDNGNYQILSGERRYQAIKKIRQEEEYANNYENVACYVVGTKDMDEYEQKLVIESANIETRDFDKNAHILNLVSLLIEMRDSGKISNEQIATEMDKYMSCSERYKRMYKTICARGTEETKEILKSGKIAVHEAAKIATMPEEAQKLAAEMINEAENGDVNYSKKDIMSAVNQAKAESKEIKKNLVNMSETGQINRALESYNANVENDMTDDFDTDDENEGSRVDDIDDVDEFLAQIESDPERIFKEKLEEIKNNKYTDLHQDSIKNVKSLINSNDKAKEDKSVEYITKWANVMMNKSRYSEEELELVDLLRQMIDCVDEKSRM